MEILEIVRRLERHSQESADMDVADTAKAAADLLIKQGERIVDLEQMRSATGCPCVKGQRRCCDG